MPEQQYCYQVEAKGVDRNVLLGYATGEKVDIIAYFEERKGYGLILNLVVPKHIPAGYAIKKQDLMEQKKALQEQMLELERKLSLEAQK